MVNRDKRKGRKANRFNASSREWKIERAVPITKVLPGTEKSYRVVLAGTGKKAWLSKRYTTFRPGHAIVPLPIARRVLGTNI